MSVVPSLNALYDVITNHVVTSSACDVIGDAATPLLEDVVQVRVDIVRLVLRVV